MTSNRNFGFLFSIFFGVLGLKPLLYHKGPNLIFLGIATSLFIVSIFSPSLFEKPKMIWLKIGDLLQKLTSPVIFSLLFSVIITPAAFLLKILGKDPLSRKFDGSLKTYWKPRESPKPESMLDQF